MGGRWNRLVREDISRKEGWDERKTLGERRRQGY